MANDGLQSYEIDSGLNIYRHFYRKDVLKGDKRKREIFLIQYQIFCDTKINIKSFERLQE